MRLGFHYHTPALMKHGKVCMPGYLGVFVDGLASRCENVVCFQHSPLKHESIQMDYAIKSANVHLESIGPHASVPQRMLFSRRYTKSIREWKTKLDVMLIRGPSPLLPAVAKSAAPLPIALLLVGDYRVNLDDIPQPAFRKALIRIWAEWNYRKQLQVAKNSLTFVNSRILYQELDPHIPNLLETRTSTLSSEIFFHRKDTCQSHPFHLLYTGRITRTKGLLELIEAVNMLIKQGYKVVLDMVGPLVKGDPVLDEIVYWAKDWGIEDRIIYHGYLSFGPDLFQFYQNADIYVLPSYFEGFPRAIWEAMANSLPVVSTSVGSIPSFISDAAVLVPPKDVIALFKAIKKLIINPELRQRLIVKGQELARANTMDARVREMVKNIEQWLLSSAGRNGK